MLALIVHPDKKLLLAKGCMLVPLSRWEDSKIPLRILREEARKVGRTPDHFVTLVKVPDTQKVHVIVGQPKLQGDALQYVELCNISSEDKEVIGKSFEMFRNPNQSELGVSWFARLILGERLASGSVKWTKDFRLIQQGVRNAATKRK
jgi:hypothetical protein